MENRFGKQSGRVLHTRKLGILELMQALSYLDNNWNKSEYGT